ncbi:dipeptidyl aminopeptidase dapB [Aspergillus novofumigatus IBT 16806]|uniref:dipeptidyl-peptidase IV n=1 Tax=Aspergillus novofumigatus (strain IBT 16806) TaxID=1392255 RepID=A0A2I1C2E0_ASPN1|nr:putative dipeptidyl-aminopeptidase B [Aspergillus novofumigatus IBT 16806]PKX91816.1 putative dipeptidyl-aminopeptidase B [Aspergillus novofumigatus IBT 16806]
MRPSDDHGETSECLPMTRSRSVSAASQTSTDSSLSTESLFPGEQKPFANAKETMALADEDQYRDLEDGEAEQTEPFLASSKKAATGGGRARRIFWILVLLCLGGWLLAFVLFLTGGRANYQTASDALQAHGADSTLGSTSTSSGKPVTLQQVLAGQWNPRYHAIGWGGDEKQGYLRVDDIRSRKGNDTGRESRVLMRKPIVHVDGKAIIPSNVWPSPDLKKVLLISEQQKNWRHSFTGKYWVLDVDSQTAQPLDPSAPDGRVQLALWSPASDAVAFVRDNNLYLRRLSSDSVVAITKDGGENLFYGVPDWVSEEEVISGNSVTWWSNDAKYIAFFRTNETSVPEFPVQYYISRPSGKKPLPGFENYPDFYDVEKNEVFSVEVADDFADDDRIIIEILWASEGKVLVRSTNRESDILKVYLIDTKSRRGKLVRSEDVAGLDGGWVEPSRSTRFIPADPDNGRPHDGYIDTVPYNGYDHLAYFTPLDSRNPVMLTSGEWEVVDAPAAIDLQRGLVYFVGTREAPTQRHVYRVQLDGSNLKPLTDTSKPGYYDVSFSHGTGYALLTYKGPSIPWQAIINTQGDGITYEDRIEENAQLAKMVEAYALPTEIYRNVTVDGYTLQLVERRPPHFNPAKKYPVLFYLYGGPGSQTVDRKFTVDFQSYVASSLGYIVVTVDGRGTGFIGRKARCIVRGNLGFYEAHDQIATAKMWAAKSYVDETRMAIWGWSFGGFMTLKTLEQDAGQTFQYGMAVAPVTDWRFYDSIYTERYMHTPQHNPSGYDNSTISDMAALSESVRFLVMHGASDDNVHLQNTLVLIDKLDLSNVENYDLQFYPDSDHSIYFHNAHTMVYERLSDWLVNAFNGEWHRIANPVPDESMWERMKRSLPLLYP